MPYILMVLRKRCVIELHQTLLSEALLDSLFFRHSDITDSSSSSADWGLARPFSPSSAVHSLKKKKNLVRHRGGERTEGSRGYSLKQNTPQASQLIPSSTHKGVHINTCTNTHDNRRYIRCPVVIDTLKESVHTSKKIAGKENLRHSCRPCLCNQCVCQENHHILLLLLLPEGIDSIHTEAHLLTHASVYTYTEKCR